MLELQVVIVCGPYYHLRARQIFMLQKVETVFTLYNMKIQVARAGGNTGNKQSQLAIATLLRYKLKEMLPVLLGLNNVCMPLTGFH